VTVDSDLTTLQSHAIAETVRQPSSTTCRRSRTSPCMSIHATTTRSIIIERQASTCRARRGGWNNGLFRPTLTHADRPSCSLGGSAQLRNPCSRRRRAIDHLVCSKSNADA
jgi:hypothetical protein